MLIYSFAFCLFCFRQRKLLRGTQIYSRFRYFLSLLFFYGSLNCSLTGQRLPMHPSVLTLLMEPLPRALLASPPGAKKLFWMTSCLIKASDHPSHNVTSCPPFPPPRGHKYKVWQWWGWPFQTPSDEVRQLNYFLPVMPLSVSGCCLF